MDNITILITILIATASIISATDEAPAKAEEESK